MWARELSIDLIMASVMRSRIERERLKRKHNYPNAVVLLMSAYCQQYVPERHQSIYVSGKPQRKVEADKSVSLKIGTPACKIDTGSTN